MITMVELSHLFSGLAAQPLLAQVMSGEGQVPWLTLTTFGPLLGILALLFIPRDQVQVLRNVALLTTLGVFAISLGVMLNFDPSVVGAANEAFTFQLLEGPHEWIPALGISYTLGVDGFSLWLVMLTTFLMPIAVWSTYSGVNKYVKEYMISLLLLQVGMVGALVAVDLFLFYIFWELMLIPMYLIIGIWGGEERVKAAITFFLYTMVGSLLMLVAIIFVYLHVGVETGTYSFLYSHLLTAELGYNQQLWLFAAFLLAFIIKVPLFPFHTWLPLAHVQAPTAGSVLLAAVMLKLGTYGLIRYAFPLFPDALVVFAPYIALLAVIGIIYGAIVALIQPNLKKLVAYSSVSHLGFCVLGLIAMTPQGLAGGMYVMIAHGIATGGLFLCVGIIYERLNTLKIVDYGGIAKVMPVFAGLFAVIMLGSAGLPGLNGFVGEFLSLFGASKSHFLSFGEYLFFTSGGEGTTGYGVYELTATSAIPAGAGAYAGPEITAFIFTIFATTGLILGAAYLIWMFKRVMFGPVVHKAVEAMPRLSAREIGVLVPIVLMTIFMGVYPKFFLAPMEPSIQQFLSYMDGRVTQAVDASAADEERRNIYGKVVVEDVESGWVPEGTMLEGAKERQQR